MRLGCGLPDGPAGAARPDRPRHRLRDPRHDVPAVARPAARAQPDPQADGHRRAARPEDRPRLLHLRRAGLGRGRRRRADARPPAAPPSGARAGADASASSARAPWRPASSRCSPRPATTSSSSPAATRRSPAVRKALERSRWTRPVQRGKLERGRPRRRPSPGSPARRRSTTSPTATWSSRRSSRTLSVKQALFATLDEICQARRGARHHDLEPAGHRVRQGHRPARGRRRHALLQPGAGHEAGRGRLARSPPRHDVARHRARGVRASSASTRSRAATGPASSSTRCCSRTSTTR